MIVKTESAQVAFTKFVTGHYLFTGVLQSLTALLPSIILYHYNLLGEMFSLPIGALFAALSDTPGPPKRRFQSLLFSIALYFCIAVLTGFLRFIPGLVYVEIIFYGLFFSLISLYGLRAGTIGTNALIIFIFNIDGHIGGIHYVANALYLSVGGLWYLLIFLTINKLRPYLAVQQLLGETIIEIGKYISLRSEFYKPDSDYDRLYKELMLGQIKIREQQDALRDILFKTREIVTESSVKSRTYMLIFLDSIDLFERVMTAQQDYKTLQENFENAQILTQFEHTIKEFSLALTSIGISIQSGLPINKSMIRIDDSLAQTKNAYLQLRNEQLTTETIGKFLMLKNIVSALEDIAQRINNIRFAAQDNRQVETKDKRLQVLNLNRFIAHEDYHLQYLLDNISLKSSHFKHALRITIALLVGYIIGMFLSMTHLYWILLTIVVIMKPAYSLSKRRNIHRIIGTFIGLAIGTLLIHFVKSREIIFICMIISMIISYSLLKINYLIAVAGITLYVMLCYAFLTPDLIDAVIFDRVVDTIIGSVIAGIVGAFVFPVWEQGQTLGLIKKALSANKNYFDSVGKILVVENSSVEQFKLDRKDALIALANLSDNFQKMLSEPKRQQFKMTHYHQFVSTSYIMTSYIASLSYYVQELKGQNFNMEFFRIYIQQIDNEFDTALQLLEHPNGASEILSSLPKNKLLESLINQRKKEIATQGINTKSAIGNDLTTLQSFQDVFTLIHSIIIDETKIIKVLLKA